MWSWGLGEAAARDKAEVPRGPGGWAGGGPGDSAGDFAGSVVLPVMKTRTILLTALLAAAPPGAAGAAAAETEPTPLISLETSEVLLRELVEVASTQLENPPNVVFRDGAATVKLPPLRLRKVSFGALMEVVERLAPVEVSPVIDRAAIGDGRREPTIYVVHPVQQPAPPQPLFRTGSAPRPNSQDRPLREIVEPIAREVSKPTRPSGFGSDPFAVPFEGAGRPAPAEAPKLTRAFATRELGLEGDAVVSAVTELWSAADPDWRQQGAKVMFHPETQMLIASASPERVAEVVEMLEQLRQSRNEGGRSRIEDLERGFRAELRDRERALESLTDQLERSRAELMDLERELLRARGEADEAKSALEKSRRSPAE